MSLTPAYQPQEFAVYRYDRERDRCTEILRTRNRTYAMEVTALRNRLCDPSGHVSHAWALVKEGR